MTRSKLKIISTKPEKFIPKSHAEDASLSEGAKDVADRPLVVYWRKLGREDRYNISSMLETKGVDEEAMIKNLGSIARYVWENCVVEVQNVLLEEGSFDSLKGNEKNRLFNTEGLDAEIAETISYIQNNSVFTESEAKN
jgi:hypothetical protein